MDLHEFKEKLKELREKHEKEISELVLKYREANLILNIGDTLKIDTKILKGSIFRGKELIKSRGAITILQCVGIKPKINYNTDTMAESVYVMEILTSQGTKRKHQYILEFSSELLRILVQKSIE